MFGCLSRNKKTGSKQQSNPKDDLPAYFQKGIKINCKVIENSTVYPHISRVIHRKLTEYRFISTNIQALSTAVIRTKVRIFS
jgi:hypothetical protein